MDFRARRPQSKHAPGAVGRTQAGSRVRRASCVLARTIAGRALFAGPPELANERRPAAPCSKSLLRSYLSGPGSAFGSRHSPLRSSSRGCRRSGGTTWARDPSDSPLTQRAKPAASVCRPSASRLEKIIERGRQCPSWPRQQCGVSRFPWLRTPRAFVSIRRHWHQALGYVVRTHHGRRGMATSITPLSNLAGGSGPRRGLHRRASRADGRVLEPMVSCGRRARKHQLQLCVDDPEVAVFRQSSSSIVGPMTIVVTRTLRPVANLSRRRLLSSRAAPDTDGPMGPRPGATALVRRPSRPPGQIASREPRRQLASGPGITRRPFDEASPQKHVSVARPITTSVPCSARLVRLEGGPCARSFRPQSSATAVTQTAHSGPRATPRPFDGTTGGPARHNIDRVSPREGPATA